MKRRRFLELLAGSAGFGFLRPGALAALNRTSRVAFVPEIPAGPQRRCVEGAGPAAPRVSHPRRVAVRGGHGPVSPELLKQLENPYFVGDQAWATQSSGWAGAWSSKPSAWAVAARTAEDVAAAVSFAREHRVRLVVKGGGHSYLGTSNAPDSLLVWTRPMDAVVLHDAFTPQGCAGKVGPVPAVSVGAGRALAAHLRRRDHRGGRYVQGGGCATVGVGGPHPERRLRQLLQALRDRGGEPARGGGRHRRRPGAHGQRVHRPGPLLGAEGRGRRDVRRGHPADAADPRAARDLRRGAPHAPRPIGCGLPPAHRALRGLLPERALQSALGRAGELRRRTTASGSRWSSRAWTRRRRRRSGGRSSTSPRRRRRTAGSHRGAPAVVRVPARALLEPRAPARRQRTDASSAAIRAPARRRTTCWWAGDQASRWASSWHGYKSTWMPAVAAGERQNRPAGDALRRPPHWSVSLHFNKGLAGAPPEAIAAARDTATNPARARRLRAGDHRRRRAAARYPGVAGHTPTRRRPARTRRRSAPRWPSSASWRPTPARTSPRATTSRRAGSGPSGAPTTPASPRIKRSYDPDGLFFVHHGVGSEDWSADGMTRVASR